MLYQWGREEKTHLKNTSRGFPWQSSGSELDCQCRGHGFDPWSGKIPHDAGQLSLYTTSTRPASRDY